MMLQTEPEKNLSKKENKPFSVKLGNFLNRTKYVLIALVLVLVTALVELLELSVDGDLSLRNITIPFILLLNNVPSYFIFHPNSAKYIFAFGNCCLQ